MDFGFGKDCKAVDTMLIWREGHDKVDMDGFH